MPTFDGVMLTVTLDAPVNGVGTVDIGVDLYKGWKDWLLVDYRNMKYPPLFEESFGGDEMIKAVLDAAAYFKMRNDYGWRIKPYEADATYNFTGILLPASSGLSLIVPTDGGFTVLINGLQPQTQNVQGIVDLLTLPEFVSLN